jgi:hypothetical protein
MSTTKTTLLPANHSLGTKKRLHSNERLDDGRDQALKSACPSAMFGGPFLSRHSVYFPDVPLRDILGH